MLRLVSRSPSAASPPRIRKSFNARRPSTGTTGITSSRVHEWTPGDPIRFDESMQRERATEWTPGQPIKFARPTAHASARQDRADREELVQTTKEIARGVRGSRAKASPATSRATYNSSPSSSLDMSGNTSWAVSHRWEPPSPSRTSIADVSSGSTAAFSHSRSYAKIHFTSRSAGRMTVGDREHKSNESETGGGTVLEVHARHLDKVDAAVQTEASPEARPLVPAPSKAEIDELVAGIDFDDDSLDFDLEPQPTSTSGAPSTSTPQHLRPTQLTQPEVEDLVGGIDFSQDLEMSDVEEETHDSYHSAIASPEPSLLAVSSQSRPVPCSCSTSAQSPRLPTTPRIVLRFPNSPASPSPPPAMPVEPDVFTLSSTSPPRIRSPSKTSRLTKSAKSSPLVLSSSSQPPSRLSSARPFSTSQISCESDDSLVEPSKMKGWESVLQSVETAQADYSGDDSVEIIEIRPSPKKADKGKGKLVEQKENEPVSRATKPKPGYFVRPANLRVSTSTSSTTTPTGLARPTSASPLLPRPTATPTATNRKPREPRRDSFKGRNAEERYKSALKQYTLQLKWPNQFDHTTWGRGQQPTVVFTTDGRVVDETLAKLSGPTGFDLEWDMFDTRTRGQGKTALVQVCDRETILLVQVARMKTFPESLRSFIEDPSKIKLGVQIAGDARKLERDFGFKPKGLLELNDLTKRYDAQHHAGRTGPLIGLQELVGIYLDRYLPKDHSVRCGVWSGILSDAQKSYGANDVYSSLHVLLALESLIVSSTGASLDLLDFTTPNSKRLPPLSTTACSTSSSARAKSSERPVPRGLESLPPRKLQAYNLFQIEKLSLKDVTSRMSETNAIKSTSVLWNLLGIYSALEKQDVAVEWDEPRLVEAVDSLGHLFTGQLAAEHGSLVKGLREKIKA